MNKINIGIIGAGRMGITHYSIINAHERVKVGSIADTSGLVLGLFGKYLPCETHKDYRDLIEKSRPDALLVCTPPNLHYEIVKLAFERGIHVFVEKPFTTSAPAAKELADLFATKPLANQVGYVNRFNDVFGRVKEMLGRDVIGRVLRYRSEMFSRTVIRKSEGGGWRGAHASGGGVTFEMASHAIDLVNYLVGQPDRVVGTRMTKIFSTNVEDAVSTTFLHRDGCTGTLYVNWSEESYRKPTNKIELFGEKGKILADQHSVRIFLREPNAEFGLRDGWNTLYITDVFKSVPFYVRGNEYTRQLFEFVDCIDNPGRPSRCSFRDGAATLAVLENLFADARNNENV